MKLVTTGLGANPGEAIGRVARTSDDVDALIAGKVPYVLVASELSKDDAKHAQGAVAIVTTTGGITADAAVIARALGKPCIVSAPLRFIEDAVEGLHGVRFSQEADVHVNGLSGEIHVISGG